VRCCSECASVAGHVRVYGGSEVDLLVVLLVVVERLDAAGIGLLDAFESTLENNVAVVNDHQVVDP